MWKVDLHCHTHYSEDSLTRPKALLRAARERGFDRIAVTEHNNLRGAIALHALAPDFVIMGEEIRTEAGELIAYFVTEEVPKGLSLTETLKRLWDQGAVISVPHPTDTWRDSAIGEEHLLTIIDKVDAIEVLNARCIYQKDNQRADTLAALHNKLRTAGSDAHTAAEVGAAYLEMPPFSTVEEFRQSLSQACVRGGTSSPLVRLTSTWAKLRRKLEPERWG